MISRVSSDPGQPRPVGQRHSQRRDSAGDGERHKDGVDEHGNARNSSEIHRDGYKNEDRARADGRIDAGSHAGIPPLQWKRGVGAPWDDRPSSFRADSVASSASQRSALLSGACLQRIRVFMTHIPCLPAAVDTKF